MSKTGGTRNHRRLLHVFRRDGERCFWCGHALKTHLQIRRLAQSGQVAQGFREATLDHVLPRDQGGTSDLYNLVAACSPCNVERSRPGNWIDRGISEGKYRLPARPRKLPQLKRGVGSSKTTPPQSAPVASPEVSRDVDQSWYVDAIPWAPEGMSPDRTGLYLVRQPDQERILLVPVRVEPGGPSVVQGGHIRSFIPTWRWCLLDELLDL